MANPQYRMIKDMYHDGVCIQNRVQYGYVLIDQSWTIDIDWHTAKITRDANGIFEIFLDGVSKGTVTDTDITTTNDNFQNNERC